MAAKQKKDETPAKPEISLEAQYEALNAKVKKALEIHWMVKEVYGSDSDLKKLAWEGYQALQLELHLLSEKIAESSPKE